jgi:predicted DNA-binding ribbon-helix-helix protein
MTAMPNVASLPDVKRVNLYFVESHWKELQAIARRTDTPVAALVRRIVAQWLRGRRKKAR